MTWTRSSGVVPGVVLGAGLAFLFDPREGRRRRALVRDRFVHWRRTLQNSVETTARDVSNRARGVVAETRGALKRGRIDERVVRERIRAELGLVVSYPGAITVSVHDGAAVLEGAVLEGEADAVRSAVARVRGVQSVEDRLERHVAPAPELGLQGGPRRVGPRIEFLQERWSPAARVLAAAAGGIVAMSALRRLSPRSGSLMLGSVGLLAVAPTNLPTRDLIARGAGAAGHLVANLFGARPQRPIGDDPQRMQAAVEHDGTLEPGELRPGATA